MQFPGEMALPTPYDDDSDEPLVNWVNQAVENAQGTETFNLRGSPIVNLLLLSNFYPEGLLTLVEKIPEGITKLSLTDNYLGHNIDILISFLMAVKDKGITLVDLSHNQLCESGVQGLLRLLPAFEGIPSLNLSDNELNGLSYEEIKSLLIALPLDTQLILSEEESDEILLNGDIQKELTILQRKYPDEEIQGLFNEKGLVHSLLEAHGNDLNNYAHLLQKDKLKKESEFETEASSNAAASSNPYTLFQDSSDSASSPSTPKADKEDDDSLSKKL